MLRFPFLLCALLFLAAASAQAQPNERIQTSLVRITATDVEPDYRAPWNSGQIERGVGAGFVIDGQRILTNAHVVSNSRFLTVEREGDPNKYPATVQFVAHDCDLATVQVANPGFWKGMKPLEFNGIPELESTVSAYGYPIGGERMSVTTGIVSRIDFNLYTHSAIDSHLAIQISAQINPGNSGGPVLQNGKVVGVAFQGYSGDIAQGVAYMIPTPVIRRFLTDIKDGHYDRYVDLGITYSKLQNPAQRRYLGLTTNDRGILVDTVIDAGPCGKILHDGDVLLAIDGHAIASDAFVEYEGERVQMPEVVERKFKGDKVKLDLLRDHKPMSVEITLGSVWPYFLQGHSYDIRPRYVLYGGLLFQPMSLDLIEAYHISDLRVRHFFDFFVSEQIYLQHPEVIILTNILPDPINSYLNSYRDSIVDEINGQKIGTLQDLARAFAQPAGRFVVKMVGDGPPLVLDAKQVESARERIKQRYNVFSEENLDEQPPAKTSVAAKDHS
ncbi:MAG TPA: trypsin-like peptidase domain-containing protein [Chthoniobacterales bacterium]|jgi:S1-C subfamily serine protease